MKKFLVNTIIFTEGKKARLVSELMGAGAVGAIVSSVCITAACVIKCVSERGYEATTVEAMDIMGKVWKELDESVNRNG